MKKNYMRMAVTDTGKPNEQTPKGIMALARKSPIPQTPPGGVPRRIRMMSANQLKR